MHDITQLNANLQQNGEQRTLLLKQIAELNELNRNEIQHSYSNLIGKYFQSILCTNCYRIIEVFDINCNKDIEVLVQLCTSSELYKYRLSHNETYVTEISLEQYESNVKNTFNNILNLKFQENKLETV